LLVAIGLLGVLVLAFDRILWETAPVHAYGLIAFLIIDFGAGALVFARPSKIAFTAPSGSEASHASAKILRYTNY